jgi:hypothetical protein
VLDHDCRELAASGCSSVDIAHVGGIFYDAGRSEGQCCSPTVSTNVKSLAGKVESGGNLTCTLCSDKPPCCRHP